MAVIIQRLLDQGHAYVAEGSEGREVLFSTASMADYGMLSKRKLEDQQAGARVAVEGHKMNPADFVLWKQSADTEPGWPASFTFEGESIAIYGRPGWHIECSAMADRYLWEEIKDRLSPKAKARPHQFDIHGGGLDLIFPHHENEIAQSCCAFDTDLMASVWMHNGFVQVEGRKMSKSDGNFVTIHDLLHTETFGGRKWPGEVLRLAMLMTHYREPIDFSVKRLEEALAILTRWERIANEANVEAGASDPQFMDLLADELRTPDAIKRIHELMNVSQWSDPKLAQDANAGTLGFGPGHTGFSSEQDRKASIAAGLASAQLLGLSVVRKLPTDLSDAVETLVQLRLEMLKTKNFAEADKIRDDLAAKGIQLKDGKDPATGERVTAWEVKR